MSVTDLIRYFFAPLGTVNMQKALCVGYRESRYDPSAVNRSSGAAGVFQFMPFIWPPVSRSAGWGGASVFDPVSNVAVAAWMMGHEGWRPWAADAEACGL
jgi:soluble lytic murein transglycosylase-like protein